MVFSSNIFLYVFLPVVLLIYFIPTKGMAFKNWTLLCASLFFYFFGAGWLVLLLIAVVVLNWMFGRLLEVKEKSKLVLVVAIVINVGLLFSFKYLNFFVDLTNDIFQALGIKRELRNLGIILPIGISFFVFQGISYCVDVYRGVISAQKNLLKYAVYKTFFPQLIAGPIVRYKTIQNQIDSRETSIENVSEGLRRFCIGLGKKVLLADSFGVVADKVFGLPSVELTSPIAWIGILCYSMQIYFDFSGYSDMAIGMGRIVGFRFDENFNLPYSSASITEFWQRWHISLSTWFRDYVYIPLGGNRKGNRRTYLNLFIVFLLCGLWHGAAVTFVVWGIYHGLFLVIERVLRDRVKFRIHRFFGWLVTFFLLLIGWVLFRAKSIDVAFSYLATMFGSSSNAVALPVTYNLGFFIDNRTIVFLIGALIFSTGMGQWVMRKLSIFEKEWIRLSFGLVVFVISIAYMAGASFNPFIYFQF